MKNDIIRKLTSLTLMSIMVAGGLTFAIPGALPQAVAAPETSGPLTVSTTEFGGVQVLAIVVDDPKIADVSVTYTPSSSLMWATILCGCIRLLPGIGMHMFMLVLPLHSQVHRP